MSPVDLLECLPCGAGFVVFKLGEPVQVAARVPRHPRQYAVTETELRVLERRKGMFLKGLNSWRVCFRRSEQEERHAIRGPKLRERCVITRPEH